MERTISDTNPLDCFHVNSGSTNGSWSTVWKKGNNRTIDDQAHRVISITRPIHRTSLPHPTLDPPLTPDTFLSSKDRHWYYRQHRLGIWMRGTSLKRTPSKDQSHQTQLTTCIIFLSFPSIFASFISFSNITANVYCCLYLPSVEWEFYKCLLLKLSFTVTFRPVLLSSFL